MAAKKKTVTKKKTAKKTASAAGSLVVDQRKKRLRVYQEVFGKPKKVHAGKDLGERAIDILVFPKKVVGAKGFALVTNGMSDHRSPKKKRSAAPQTELYWYVRDASPEKVRFLYWLANQPFESGEPYEFGSFVDVPKDAVPPYAGATFLRPITVGEQLMHTPLALMTGYFEGLVVHMLHAREIAATRKSDRKFDAFLDAMDARGYPFFLDPKRPSYV